MFMKVACLILVSILLQACLSTLSFILPPNIYVPAYYDANRVVYGDESLRKAFPELKPTDKRLRVCINRMKDGASEVTYLSNAQQNSVTVKTALCNKVSGGLMCRGMQANSMYFYKHAENFFTLSDGVNYEEAENILAAYESTGIKGFSERSRKRSNPPVEQVTEIGRKDDSYYLSIGNVYCGGCVHEYNVKFEDESIKKQLVLTQKISGFCI